MSKVKFPKRLKDGSFCVEIALSITTNEPEILLCKLKEWFVKWGEANKRWTRVWSNREIEELFYEHEFKHLPHLVSCSTTELRILLEGQPDSKKMWKDWLVLRILPELKDAFAEIHDVIGIKDCD
jgi:hypothetical protein